MKVFIGILIAVLIGVLGFTIYNQNLQNNQYKQERTELYENIDELQSAIRDSQIENDSLKSQVEEMDLVVKNLQSLKFTNHEIIEDDISSLISSSDADRLEYFNSWTITD